MEPIPFIVKKTGLPETSVSNTLELFEQECTIPFISRYRKERTGNLDEVQIGAIFQGKTEFEALRSRKEAIIRSLKEQDALTEDLLAQVEAASDLNTLEDLYLPYKRKKKTKAEKARNNGLEPLARIIMSQKPDELERIASRYLNKEVTSTEAALDGARHIIAEWISERKDIRSRVRWHLKKETRLTTQTISSKEEEEKALKFKDYFDWSEDLRSIPSHRLLAILRAEREGYIRLRVEADHSRIVEEIENKVLRSNDACGHQIRLAIQDGYKRLLFPSMSNEALQNAKVKADEEAITVFAKNLRQLLLGAPLGEKRILAIDPGYRTGCKLVCLNAQGGLEYNETIYPHPPVNDFKGSVKKLQTLADAYKIEAIAIGNGTASRETEKLVRTVRFSRDVEVFVVNEAGASIYSASRIAREEFPDYDVTVRGAVSIGRRLSDPLAELVKIDPKSIGVGQYQHDVDQGKLKYSLDSVVESCVNAIGVNLNTASIPLLSYVSGIGPKLAENIVAYRKKQGPFRSREDILKVPRLGGKAYEQSAGFLRIKNASNPLDDSAVHPERYSLVERMARDEKRKLSEMIGKPEILGGIDLHKYCSEEVGLPTLQDIVKELEKPGADPREKARQFTFDQSIRSIDDLQPGKMLPGIVNNITNFGCFVDIGIKENGLIHVSNLSKGYVSDVNTVVAMHQQIIVKVLEVDRERKRIQLALVS